MPRPPRMFNNFVGHPKLIAYLANQLTGAKLLGEPAPPMLFMGESGVGKTKLARACAGEFGATLVESNGFASVTDLARLVSAIKSRDFLFVDEAHNLTPAAQEFFFKLIEEGKLPDWPEVRRALDPGSLLDQSPEFTPIFATDQPSRLLNALQNRLQIQISIARYSDKELREVIKQIAPEINILLTGQAVGRIADASAGLPRNARHHLQNLRRHCAPNHDRSLGVDDVRDYLSSMGLDDHGLCQNARRYLIFLASVPKASIVTIANALGMEAEYLRQGIETQLIRAHFVEIGSGGRRLTSPGRELVTKIRQIAPGE